MKRDGANLYAFAVRVETEDVAAGQLVRLDHRLEVGDVVHVLVHVRRKHLHAAVNIVQMMHGSACDIQI